MERLTKTQADGTVFYTDENLSFGDCLRKLCKLEDLEEQLKMSLEDFYKCVTHDDDNFYVIVKNDDTEQLEIVEVEKDEGYTHYYIQGIFYFIGESEKGLFYEYPIACYGKDMFLTYEEAAKKLEEMKNEEEISL